MSKSMQQIQEQKLKELIEGVTSFPDWNDFTQVLEYFAVTGRLALLGLPEYLHHIQKAISPEQWIKFEKQLQNHWLEILDNWFEKNPMELSSLFIEIQDFTGIWKNTIYPFSFYSQCCWDLIINRELETILEDETADKLNEYHAIYPIPEDDCITSIQTPVTFTMLDLLDDVLPFNPVNYAAKWNSLKNVWEIDAQEKGVFAVSWQNTPERALFRVFPYSSEISGLTGIGAEPVIHNAERPQNWIVPYRKNAADYLKEGFTLRFLDGSEATIPLNDSAPVIQTETLQTRKQNVLKREHSLLAADSKQDFDYFTVIWQAKETKTRFSGTFVDDTFRIRTNDSKFVENISKIILGGLEMARQNETSWTLPLQNILEFVKGNFSENWTLEIYMKDDPIPYILNTQETGND